MRKRGGIKKLESGKSKKFCCNFLEKYGNNLIYSIVQKIRHYKFIRFWKQWRKDKPFKTKRRQLLPLCISLTEKMIRSSI